MGKDSSGRRIKWEKNLVVEESSGRRIEWEKILVGEE